MHFDLPKMPTFTSMRNMFSHDDDSKDSPAPEDGPKESQKKTHLQTMTAIKLDTHLTLDEKISSKSLTELRDSGITLEELKPKCGEGLIQYSDLRLAGYTVEEFRSAGIHWPDIKKAGFTTDEIKEYASKPGELKLLACCQNKGGYSAAELRAAGFDDPSVLKVECFTVADLKEVFTPTELRSRGRGFNAKELKAAGYSAQDLHTAGFSAIDLKVALFTGDELREAGYSKVAIEAAGLS